MLGWQPYYFPSEAIVQPGRGTALSSISTNPRFTNTENITPDWTVETAVDAAKPGRNEFRADGFPRGGYAWRLPGYKAASGLGSGTPLVGLSAAVSTVMIPIRTASAGSATGSVAVAFDALVPLIPSSDGKSASNTMSLTAEYSNGRGIGGLELAEAPRRCGYANGPRNLRPADCWIPVLPALYGGNAGSHPRFQTYRTDLTYIYPRGKFSSTA